jgi:hypothetical protein
MHPTVPARPIRTQLYHSRLHQSTTTKLTAQGAVVLDMLQGKSPYSSIAWYQFRPNMLQVKSNQGIELYSVHSLSNQPLKLKNVRQYIRLPRNRTLKQQGLWYLSHPTLRCSSRLWPVSNRPNKYVILEMFVFENCKHYAGINFRYACFFSSCGKQPMPIASRVSAWSPPYWYCCNTDTRSFRYIKRIGHLYCSVKTGDR